MRPDRWQKLDEIFNAALQHKPDERKAYIEKACSGDEGLRRELESLLAAERASDKFLEKPAMDIMAGDLANEQREFIGRDIGPYKILSLLGRGGMGLVYRAKDRRLGRDVALKILPSELRLDRDRMERFTREARAASALNHPNVAHIYEIGEADGTSFIAMEYVEGQTLEAKIGGRPLDVDQIVEIGIQVTDALDEAHTKGITHRDIKPANLMLTPRSQVKVLDFGLAKFAELGSQEASTAARTVTTPGLVMGTVAYMSPEQVLGREVDHRTDIFSLGVVLYEMTTGRLPFAGVTTSETMDRILHVQPEAIARFNYGVPPELERIIRKCLEKDRERRFQSARELLVDLKNLKRDSDPGEAKGIFQKEVPRKQLTAQRLLAFLATAAVIVLLLVYLWFRNLPGANVDIKSLAVIPLENLSGDATQDYFADGMTEALITNLAKIKALRVISRTSVTRYKKTRKPLSEIARELNVDAIVEGAVMRSGTRVQVTAQLIHAATDRHLWGDSYERDIQDILKLQNEVARTVAGEIKVQLTKQEQVRLAKVPSVNPEAYELYVRGKSYTYHGSKLDNETAIGMFKRAVEIDPKFAAGWGELANAYLARVFFFEPEEKQWTEKANNAAEMALSLDPDSLEGYLAKGSYLWRRSNGFPHEMAMKEYRQAVALHPNSDEAHSRMATIYNHVGLLKQGLQEARTALAIDPSSVAATQQIANSLLWQGKFEESLAAWETISKGANSSVVGSHSAWALLQLGKKEEAKARIEEFLREHTEDPGGLLTGMQALLLATSGEHFKSETQIKKATEKEAAGHFHHTAHYVASAYARMNKPEPAIYWLRQAADTGFPCYPLFERDTNLDSLRKDSRFLEFMKEMKRKWEHYQATL